MKKNIIYSVVAIFAATLMLSSCAKKNVWITDFSKAKIQAEKKNKNIFLVFSGEDWNDQSKSLKNDILETKEFKKEIAPQYILALVELSRSEFAKTVTDENSTEEQKKEAERITAEYAEKENLMQQYYVETFPSIYIVSPEGYVLSSIPYTDAMTSLKDLSAELESHKEIISTVADAIKVVKKSEGTEKVLALDDLYEKTSENFRPLLNPAVSEVPSLDPSNKTGLVGKYELINGYASAIEKIMKDNDINGAVKVFTDLCDSDRITDAQKQEALYTAAFMMARTGSPDYDTMQSLLKKAFEFLPESDMAHEIIVTMDSIQRMKETVMKMQAEAQIGDASIDASGTAGL